MSLSQSQLTGLIDKDDLKTQDFNSGAHLEEAVVEKDSKYIFEIVIWKSSFYINIQWEPENSGIWLLNSSYDLN